MNVLYPGPGTSQGNGLRFLESLVMPSKEFSPSPLILIAHQQL